jgi:thiamine pyrophosphokinase
MTLPLPASLGKLSESLIVAADGGTKHAQALGLVPHVIVGDLDSLPEQEAERLESAGSRLIRYPPRKDFTDLELALQQVQLHDITEVLVLGALGNRWDQTLANLLLPAAENFQNLSIRLVDGAQEISLIREGQRVEISGRAGDTVSLIPLGGDAGGITTGALEYPLAGETLRFGSSRGVSNVMLGEKAAVSLEKGLLLCVIIHQEGEEKI